MLLFLWNLTSLCQLPISLIFLAILRGRITPACWLLWVRLLLLQSRIAVVPYAIDSHGLLALPQLLLPGFFGDEVALLDDVLEVGTASRHGSVEWPTRQVAYGLC